MYPEVEADKLLFHRDFPTVFQMASNFLLLSAPQHSTLFFYVQLVVFCVNSVVLLHIGKYMNAKGVPRNNTESQEWYWNKKYYRDGGWTGMRDWGWALGCLMLVYRSLVRTLCETLVLDTSTYINYQSCCHIWQSLDAWRLHNSLYYEIFVSSYLMGALLNLATRQVCPKGSTKQKEMTLNIWNWFLWVEGRFGSSKLGSINWTWRRMWLHMECNPTVDY